ncbi:MAG: beta-glucosidase [Planctomycetes bacterium SM23_32]|nr:MAG: beta-glucosidase [Planctomycetes bacterium SM23_32]
MTDDAPARQWEDPDLPVQERVGALVAAMTLAEKVSQMVHVARGISRLGVPDYNWWNECLHGVARAGRATVFPQAIGLAASFNEPLMHRVATAISDEARAKHHQALRQGNRGQYFGLTCWSPNINIFRDPRWGRGQETYGEDPYLTARMGVAFVKGLQGEDPDYLKLVATPKHYAVHSGKEADRHHFDAVVSLRDLRETYLPAFKACVQEAGAYSVMGAYNRTLGEPCCASRLLLEDVLRGEWGFEGYVVSDCGAIRDIHENHCVADGPAQSAALAVSRGCDLNCGEVYGWLLSAVEQGLIEEAAIDVSLKRLMTARMRLGMFDPPERVPWAQIPPDVVGCQDHAELALRVARESIVLLKNEGGLLPLSKELRAVAVVGPNANSMDVLLGNYNGYPARYVTGLEGVLAKVAAGTQVDYAAGCGLCDTSRHGFEHAVGLASRSDVVIAFMGLSATYEGEEGSAYLSEANGDRERIGLPGVQEDLLKELHATGTPVVLVLTSGSAVEINWAQQNLPAVLQAWYPGQEGGTAVADALFGDYSPGGRLPVTFVKSLDQLPPFEDYAMAKGRTYRFMREEPLYRFGYGLSYTTFEYCDLRLSQAEIGPGESVEVTVNVRNTGGRAGDEVVQLYVSDVEASVPVPLGHLEGFRRIALGPGEQQEVAFTLGPAQLCAYGDDGTPFVEPGEFRISVGGGQPDDPAGGAVTAVLTVRG